MYSRSKSIALVLIASIAVFSIVSLKLLSPPAVVPSSQGDEEFSAERALIFLSVIAREPHSSGTAAHAQVRDYIYTYCQRMGLETELMDQTGMNVYSNSVRAGRTQNILARLKGTQSGKTILVMSHYDSQPNTPGATDDGAGVAAMMEAIRLLKNSQPLKNDVLFLFTDLEESGLFGAESFVSHYKNLEEIGLIVNFEARGNSGVSFTFEV
jgi:acetylornithine deacetylase/succinyl-diaminopimelate desuccinylase-like protein